MSALLFDDDDPNALHLPGMSPAEARGTKRCANPRCGRTFYARRVDQKYHSGPCKQAHYRATCERVTPSEAAARLQRERERQARELERVRSHPLVRELVDLVAEAPLRADARMLLNSEHTLRLRQLVAILAPVTHVPSEP